MGRNLLGIILLAACSLQAQNPYPEATARKQYEMGVYDMSLNTYLTAEKKQGLTSEELALVGDIYEKAGQFTLAENYYQKALTHSKDADHILLSKARLAIKKGNYQSAQVILAGMNKSAAVDQLMAGIEFAQGVNQASPAYEVSIYMASPRPDFALTFMQNIPVFNTYGPLNMSARSAEAVRSQIGFSLATKENGKMIPFFEGMTNRLNIGSVSFSENGKCVFTRSLPLCEYAACRNQNASIYVADYEAGSLSAEKSLEINQLGVSNFDPFISADGKTIYFASTREGGFGGSDLYKIESVNGKWSQPLNLGSEINTAGDEVSPMVRNGKLYFASNGHIGLGGFDIYSSMEGKSVMNENGLNSSADDTYPYVTSEGRVYLTSNRLATEQENIYVANPKAAPMPEAVALNSQPTAKNPTLGSMQGAKRVSSGSIINKSTSVVYYIQLAAFNKNKYSDFSQFRDVVKFGNVYKFETGPAVKIRLGYFLTEQETRNVLAKIKKSGYPDAFIVSNALNTAEMELVLSSYDAPGTPASTPSTSSSTTAAASNFDSGLVQSYKVRLASYEDPIWFDLKKVNDLGNIEQWSKGNWTIFILSGFRNFQEAEAAKVKAVNRGFASAEVVIDNGGVIETIKKN